VYVAAGNCQPDQNPGDWPSKNINTEEVEKTIKSGSGKHYFVKVSTQSSSQKGIQNTFAGFPSLKPTGISDIPDGAVFPAGVTLWSLQDYSTYSTDRLYSGIKLNYSKFFDYKNPSKLLHLEIRAGPCLA